MQMHHKRSWYNNTLWTNSVINAFIDSTTLIDTQNPIGGKVVCDCERLVKKKGEGNEERRKNTVFVWDFALRQIQMATIPHLLFWVLLWLSCQWCLRGIHSLSLSLSGISNSLWLLREKEKNSLWTFGKWEKEKQIEVFTLLYFLGNF